MNKKKSILVREYVKAGEELGVIRVNESPFLHLFATIKNVEIEDNMELVDIIKINNINEVDIDKELIIHNFKTGEKEEFIFYLSTSSQIKNNNAWFIKKSCINDIKNLEYIVSTGFLYEIDNKEIAINKDIIARLSLLFTGAYKTSIIPNVVIVPDVNYKVKKNVKVFEGTELVNKDDYELDVTAFDGCGIASNSIFKRISKELNMDYIPSWVTIRSPKMALKGLLTNVNFQQYFEDKHIKDTETFKRVNGEFYIKDMFGDFVKVDDNTIIINESMAKWAKYYDSMDQYNKKQLFQFKHLTDCLYVAKVAKKEAKEYTITSYQSLCAMAITPQALQRLSEPAIEFYHRVCSFEKVAILEMLKIEGNADNSDVKLTADKISTLLSINFEKFIEMNWIKKSLIVMIERKIKELMSGSIPVKGNFKVLVADPIAFMNFTMTGSLIPELKENEFYVKGELGKRAIMRFPIASPYELTTETLVDNEVINRYCNFTNEMIVINQVGIDAMIKSGADFDGDTFQCIENQDIINSIVPCERVFINVNDGKTAKMPYNWNNRVAANIAVKGNLIGKIAITASTICDKALELGFIENDRVLKFDELRSRFESNEQTYEYISKLTKLQDMPENYIRKYFINEFEKSEINIFKCVEESMIAIDAPKTMVLNNFEKLNELTNSNKYKPAFFYFLPDKDYKRSSCSYVNSVLSNQCGFIFNTLFRRFSAINNIASYMNDGVFTTVVQSALLLEINKDNVELIKESINKSYTRFNKDLEIMKASDYVTDENNVIVTEIINGKEMFKEEAKYTDEEKKIIYKNICLSQELTALEIYENNNENDVTYAVAALALEGKKNSHRFILDFYFRSIIKCLELTNSTVVQLSKNDNGEHIGMFHRYNLVEFKNENMASKNTRKMVDTINRKLEGNIKLRMSLDNPEQIVLDKVEIRDLNVICNNIIIGKIFADGLVKNNITINDIQGDINVSNFIKSPSGKSAELLLGAA